MEDKKEYIIQKLSDLLNHYAKEELIPLFKNFHTKLDTDVETFLVEKAIDYENTGAGRTYLIVNPKNGNDIYGFFTIGLNTLNFKDGFDDVDLPYNGAELYKDNNLPVYVLFLIGKNDTCPKKIKMFEIFNDYGISIIQQSKHNVGGSILYIDCTDNLVEKYAKLKFEQFSVHEINDPKDGTIRLNTMIRSI